MLNSLRRWTTEAFQINHTTICGMTGPMKSEERQRREQYLPLSLRSFDNVQQHYRSVCHRNCN